MNHDTAVIRKPFNPNQTNPDKSIRLRERMAVRSFPGVVCHDPIPGLVGFCGKVAPDCRSMVCQQARSNFPRRDARDVKQKRQRAIFNEMNRYVHSIVHAFFRSLLEYKKKTNQNTKIHYKAVVSRFRAMDPTAGASRAPLIVSVSIQENSKSFLGIL
jgi:hypothetical protein